MVERTTDDREGAFGGGFDVELVEGVEEGAGVTKARGLTPGFHSHYTSSLNYFDYALSVISNPLITPHIFDNFPILSFF